MTAANAVILLVNSRIWLWRVRSGSWKLNFWKIVKAWFITSLPITTMAFQPPLHQYSAVGPYAQNWDRSLITGHTIRYKYSCVTKLIAEKAEMELHRTKNNTPFNIFTQIFQAKLILSPQVPSYEYYSLSTVVKLWPDAYPIRFRLFKGLYGVNFVTGKIETMRKQLRD